MCKLLPPFDGIKTSSGDRELVIDRLDEFREPNLILIDYHIRKKIAGFITAWVPAEKLS